MGTCEWAGCSVLIHENRRGRPKKFCAEHAKASKRKRDSIANFKRRTAGVGKRIPPCCRDARIANPRCRICAQHRQWNQWLKDQRKRWGTSLDRDAISQFASEYSAGAVGNDRNFRVAEKLCQLSRRRNMVI